MDPKVKASQLYKKAYSSWCYELSHDKNVTLAKNICDGICEEVLSDSGADRGYLFWTLVRDAIKNSTHEELYYQKLNPDYDK